MIFINSEGEIGIHEKIFLYSNTHGNTYGSDDQLLTLDMGSIKYVDPKILEEFMSTKITETTAIVPVPVTEEFKDQNQKYNLSKMELDLYHEENDISEKVIRVKRQSMPNKGHKWKISENAKVMMVIEGTKLTNKEKDFLCTAEGFNFLIAQYKLGIKSFNALKAELKKKLK